MSNTTYERTERNITDSDPEPRQTFCTDRDRQTDRERERERERERDLCSETRPTPFPAGVDSCDRRNEAT